MASAKIDYVFHKNCLWNNHNWTKNEFPIIHSDKKYLWNIFLPWYLIVTLPHRAFESPGRFYEFLVTYSFNINFNTSCQIAAINLITRFKLLGNFSSFRTFSQFRVFTPTFLLLGIRCTVQIRFSVLKKGNRKTLNSVNSKLKVENWCEAIFSIKDKLVSWKGPQRQIFARISSPFR